MGFLDSLQFWKSKNITLNQAQATLLEKMFPGFKNIKSEEDLNKLSERVIAGVNDTDAMDDFREAIKENLQSGNLKNYHVAAALSAVYTKVSRYWKDIIREIDKVRNNYLVDLIINQITEDALAPDVSTGEILNVFSKNTKINKELKYLDEKFKFDDFVADFTPDLCAYGEQTFSTKIRTKNNKEKQESITEKMRKKFEKDSNINEEKSELDNNEEEGSLGLVELNDDVPHGTVIGISKGIEIDGYLVINDKDKIEKRSNWDYVKFRLGKSKIRIDLHQEFAHANKNLKQAMKDIPRFVRIGKGFIYPIIAKLKELELLEVLVPATKINKLSSGTLIGMNVPSGTKIEDAMKASRKLEGIINKKVGIDTQKEEISLVNIMSSAGRVKIVPQFGEKGSLSKLDHHSEEPDDLLSSIRDIREVVSTTIGIPFEILFLSDTDKKVEILKRYARYIRKLKSVQKAISDGIRQIIYVHLVNVGISFTPKDIEIEFRNKLVEVDQLDKLEFADTVVSMLGNIKSFFYELAEEDSPLAGYVNFEGLVKVLNEYLKSIGLSGAIRDKPLKEPETVPDEEDDEEETQRKV